MAVSTLITPEEYAALEAAAEKYGVRLRYLVRDVVRMWVEDPTTGLQLPEGEPTGPTRELRATVYWTLYVGLRNKSMKHSFHMQDGLREAARQWLALDVAGMAPIPSLAEHRVWDSEWRRNTQAARSEEAASSEV